MAWTKATLKLDNYYCTIEHLGDHCIGYVYYHDSTHGYSIIHQRVYDTSELARQELEKLVKSDKLRAKL
jgi:hypothetical protein